MKYQHFTTYNTYYIEEFTQTYDTVHETVNSINSKLSIT